MLPFSLLENLGSIVVSLLIIMYPLNALPLSHENDNLANILCGTRRCLSRAMLHQQD